MKMIDYYFFLKPLGPHCHTLIHLLCWSLVSTSAKEISKQSISSKEKQNRRKRNESMLTMSLSNLNQNAVLCHFNPSNDHCHTHLLTRCLSLTFRSLVWLLFVWLLVLFAWEWHIHSPIWTEHDVKRKIRRKDREHSTPAQIDDDKQSD